MLGRAACALVLLAAVAFALPSCGTTTSVSGPYSDAGELPPVILDGGVDVKDPPEGGLECPAGKCNYQLGTGCQPGFGCRPQFTATSPDVNPGCEPAGTGVVGSTCKAQADCAAGYYCAEGSCRKQCCAGDWSACDPGESCIRQVSVHAGDSIVDSGLGLCFPVNDCDPLQPGPCNGVATRECKIVDPTGAVACEPLTTAREGDDCAPSSACAAGLSCVLDKCRKLCRAVVGGTPACTADEGTCIHFNRDPKGVGECTPKLSN
jgi:hypothetical protein